MTSCKAVSEKLMPTPVSITEVSVPREGDHAPKRGRARQVMAMEAIHREPVVTELRRH